MQNALEVDPGDHATQGVRASAAPGRAAEFFAYARERHSIYLKRLRGDPWPWTDDPILQKFRFTNVFRELDRTTEWFRYNVRDDLDTEPECLLATVFFRWFNRIETGQVLFGQRDLLTGLTAWESFLQDGDTTAARRGLLLAYPYGPWVTGSYMIRSPDGMTKLDGMLHLCQQFYHESRWRTRAEWLLAHPGQMTLERFTRWLQDLPGMGPFLAYEVTCDLRYTDLLGSAPDVSSWANVGPGALRGLARLHGRRNDAPRRTKHTYKVAIPETQAVREMFHLLQLSRNPAYWPAEWTPWEMREVEHTLCEVDKYERVRLGEGAPRQLFRTPRPIVLTSGDTPPCSS